MPRCPVDRADWPAALQARPVCPRRKLPIPFINEIRPDGTGEFGIFDDRQIELCLARRLCAMCGDPLGELVALIGDGVSLACETGYYIEPPVHERCGEIALAGLCPFISGELVPRLPVSEGIDYVTPDPAALAAIGREVAKRPLAMAVCREYGVAWTPGHTGALVMVYQPGPVIERVRWWVYRDRWATEIPVPERWPARHATPPPPPRLVTVVRSQPRRQSRAARGRRPA